ncbi:MAG: cell division protein FtsL [Erysipelotrichaceae bacterium]
MAKVIKNKRKVRVEAIAVLFFVISILLFLSSSLFLKSYNVSLSKEVSEMENVVAKKKDDVESLRLAVKTLENRDRVLSVAKEAGMEINQNNVVFVEGQNE